MRFTPLTFATGRDNAIFLKTYPAEWIVIHQFRLLTLTCQPDAPPVSKLKAEYLEHTMTGGNSAVRTRDATG